MVFMDLSFVAGAACCWRFSLIQMSQAFFMIEGVVFSRIS